MQTGHSFSTLPTGHDRRRDNLLLKGNRIMDQTAVFALMDQRFGHGKLMSLATVEGTRPSVRGVTCYYEKGSFYMITDANTEKMRHIAQNPAVAICGDWFSGHGVGENLGHPRENPALVDTLRRELAEWYRLGHVDEADEAVCILRVKLTDGVLIADGTKYKMDFSSQPQL